MEIKKVIDDIEDMTKEHHIEIFKILTSYDIKYTENNNGIFINMSNMNPDCLKKINDYVYFINENNKKLIEFEQVKEDSILKLSSEETI
jgi:hypothetical protein